jgi:hypothetical protein
MNTFRLPLFPQEGEVPKLIFEKTLCLFDGTFFAKQQYFGQGNFARSFEAIATVVSTAVLFEDAETIIQRYPGFTDSGYQKDVDKTIIPDVIKFLEEKNAAFSRCEPGFLYGDYLSAWIPRSLKLWDMILLAGGSRLYPFLREDGEKRVCGLYSRPSQSVRFEYVTVSNLQKAYKLTPEQMEQLAALTGDNRFPGVHGIGEKTARSLLQKYGSIRAIYMNLGRVTSAQRTKLQNGKAQVPIQFLNGETSIFSSENVPSFLYPKTIESDYYKDRR